MDGPGYGFKTHLNDNRRCSIGTKLLMEDDGRKDKYINCAYDGEVCYKKSGDIPDGWIVMGIDDVNKYSTKCRKALGDWDIVALQDGTVDGPGYGFKTHQNDNRRCTIGTKLLMEDDGRRDKYIDCPYDGEVCYKKSGKIPDGWIVMGIDDVNKYSTKCRNALGDWDIVALQDGTVDGPGYGFKTHNNDSRRCTIGTKLLMEDDGRAYSDKYINC